MGIIERARQEKDEEVVSAMNIKIETGDSPSPRKANRMEDSPNRLSNQEHSEVSSRLKTVKGKNRKLSLRKEVKSIPFSLVYTEANMKKPRLHHHHNERGYITKVTVGKETCHHHEHRKIDVNALSQEEKVLYNRFGEDYFTDKPGGYYYEEQKDVSQLQPLINIDEIRAIIDRFSDETLYLKYKEILETKRDTMSPRSLR